MIMSEENKHNSFFSGEESPVRVPSAEDAWGLMRQQLDVRMPVSVPQHVWLRGARLWTPVVAGVVVAVVGVMLVVRKPAGRHAGGAKVGRVTSAVKTTSVVKTATDATVSGVKAADTVAAMNGVAAATTMDTTDAVRDKAAVSVAVGSDGVRKLGRKGGEKRVVGGRSRSEVEERSRREEKKNSKTGVERSERHEVMGSNRGEAVASGGHQVGGSSRPRRDSSHKDEWRKVTALAVIGIGPVRVLPNRLVGGKGAAGARAGKDQAGASRGASKNKPANSRAVDKNLPAGEGEMIWAAGLWDGEHYTVDGQTKYGWTSSDGKTLLADHLPGAYARLYMGDRWYVEAGIRLYSPQYTRSVKIDSLGGTTSVSNVVNVSDTVVTIKKLYYTDIPVTVHFRVVAGLYVGVGLQYSRLWDGAAIQNITSFSSGGGVTTGPNGAFDLDLKDIPHSFDQIKKSDWRVLLDVSYYWRRLSAGMRYQQGISPYTESPLTGGIRPRNSSFNVYLSYDIWKQHRKK
jgi:hypothetical protein